MLTDGIGVLPSLPTIQRYAGLCWEVLEEARLTDRNRHVDLWSVPRERELAFYYCPRIRTPFAMSFVYVGLYNGLAKQTSFRYYNLRGNRTNENTPNQ